MLTYDDIVSAQVLFDHLNDPHWAIIDCRFNLQKPEWGLESYQQSHIPGAVYAHLNQDLSGPLIPGKTGRHPLPAVPVMASCLSKWGIGSDTQVVVYDTSGGSMGARLWWLLRFLGHPGVAVLDGGFQIWQQAHLPVSDGIELRQPATFLPAPDWDMLVDAEEVDRIRQNPDYVLIDARAPERYRGEVEPIDPVSGHIPGAVNRFHGSNLQPDGTFLPPETLKSQFNALLGKVPPEHAVLYCGSGVTSIHHLIAMQRAGLKGGKLYLGSWSHWILDPDHPISKT